jgi:hypothetical protein
MVRGVYACPDARDLRLYGMVWCLRNGASGGVADRRTKRPHTRRPSGLAKVMALRLGPPVGTRCGNRDATRLIKRMPPQLQTRLHKDATNGRTNGPASPVPRGCATPLVTHYRKRMTRRICIRIDMRVLTPPATHMATPQCICLHRRGKHPELQCVTRRMMLRLSACMPARLSNGDTTGLTTGDETYVTRRVPVWGPSGMTTGMQTECNMRVTRIAEMCHHMHLARNRPSAVSKRLHMRMRSGL